MRTKKPIFEKYIEDMRFVAKALNQSPNSIEKIIRRLSEIFKI